MSRLIKSFGYAIQGLKVFFRNEKNGRIELYLGLLTIIFGLLLKISFTEWIAILICIGTVLSLEMLNSALEKLIDHLHPQKHPNIKIVKDMAAGAVLLFSLLAFVIGILIFLPKIISFCHF